MSDNLKVQVHKNLIKDGKINWKYFVGVHEGYGRESEYLAAVDILLEKGILQRWAVGIYGVSHAGPFDEFGNQLYFVSEQDAYDYSRINYNGALYRVYTYEIKRQSNDYGEGTVNKLLGEINVEMD